MKVSEAHNNTAEALADAQVHSLYQGVLGIFTDLPVPIYPEKSSKQGKIDLAHAVLNAMAEYWLKHVDWTTQRTLADLTGGVSKALKTIDFVYELPDGRFVAMEVQFGNGGRLQADFAKFRTLFKQDKLALGIAVYFDRETATSADSGLACFEAAEREMGTLDDMPVALVGLSRKDSVEVDLRSLKGIVFPSILGGSGRNRQKLHEFIAQQVIDRVDLSTVELSDELLNIVWEHAEEHLEKSLGAAAADLMRILACQHEKFRDVLLGRFVDFLRNSYVPQDEQARVVKAAGVATVAREAAMERERLQKREERRRERAQSRKTAQSVTGPKASSKAMESSLSRKVEKPVAAPAVVHGEAAETAVPTCASPAPMQEAPVAKAVTHSIGVEATAALPSPRVRRVSKAEEQERLRVATDRVRLSPQAVTKPVPQFNAMGSAFARAMQGRAA